MSDFERFKIEKVGVGVQVQARYPKARKFVDDLRDLYGASRIEVVCWRFIGVFWRVLACFVGVLVLRVCLCPCVRQGNPKHPCPHFEKNKFSLKHSLRS